MTDLAGRLARLTPAQRQLLARYTTAGADAPAPVSADALTGQVLVDLTATGPDRTSAVRRFYDNVNGQLNSSIAGRYAQFLNYGYLPDGVDDRSVHQLPARVMNRNCVRLVLETVGDHPLDGAAVLDVGSGRGGTIATLNTYWTPAMSIGVDLSPVAIAFCTSDSRPARSSFVCADAEALPLRSGCFDAVINIESSHSYSDLAAFYREVRRVLRPGGVFLYADTIPRNKLAARLASWPQHGFELQVSRDITRNVLRSCDELAAVHAGAFGPGNDPSLLGDFLATPGSANYESMASARTTYGIWRLVRR